MSIAVEFQDVVKRFPNATENAVDHVSFQIQEKEMITILGTSGCGKTTLMKMVFEIFLLRKEKFITLMSLPLFKTSIFR